jgi:hypothetical protein
MRSLALLSLLLIGCAQPSLLDELDALGASADEKASISHVGWVESELEDQDTAALYDFELDLYDGAGSDWARLQLPVGALLGVEQDWLTLTLEGELLEDGGFAFNNTGEHDWSLLLEGSLDAEGTPTQVRVSITKRMDQASPPLAVVAGTIITLAYASNIIQNVGGDNDG